MSEQPVGVSDEQLRGRLDQLWGWAKAGKQKDPHDPTVEYYLMDTENVDSFTRHVLDLVADLARPRSLSVGVSDEAVEAAAGDYSQEEIAAKIADRVPHADMDGFTLSERLRIGKAVAPLFAELVGTRPQPTLDGEALDRAAEAWQEFHDAHGGRFPKSALKTAFAAAYPLVRPLPTREQIERTLRKRLVDSNFNNHLHEPVRTQTIDQWVDVLAGAVLALMGGTETEAGE